MASADYHRLSDLHVHLSDSCTQPGSTLYSGPYEKDTSKRFYAL